MQRIKAGGMPVTSAHLKKEMKLKVLIRQLNYHVHGGLREVRDAGIFLEMHACEHVLGNW